MSAAPKPCWCLEKATLLCAAPLHGPATCYCACCVLFSLVALHYIRYRGSSLMMCE